MLTQKEIRFLRDHLFPDTALECREPVSERYKDLAARGYCKLLPGRAGPLGLYDGSTMIKLTEAGKQLVIYLETKAVYSGDIFGL